MSEERLEGASPALEAPYKRCTFRHPTLSNRCTKAEGHENNPDREKRGHSIDIGPNHPGIPTEEVQAFHSTEEP